MLIVAADPGLDGGIAVLGVAGTAGRREETVTVARMPTEAHFTGKGREIDVCGVLTFIIKHLRQYAACEEPRGGAGDAPPTVLETVGLMVIEQVGHTPIAAKGEVRQNPKSMFTFGDGFGLLRAVAKMNRWPVHYAPPKEWQRVLPAKARENPKKGALSFASRRYPDVNLLATDKSTKPHDGIVDALCILEFARRMYGLKEGIA